MTFSEQDSEQEREAKIVKLVAKRQKEIDDKIAFSDKHGFAYKRSQDFKNCLIVKWRMSRKKYEINYPRLNEYVKLCEDLSDKYDLWEKDDPLMESEFRLVKIGICCIHESGLPTWAIPDEYKEVQAYVLSKLPEWAKATRKSANGRNVS